MRYILDTHILWWWYVESIRVPQNYLELLDAAKEKNEKIGLSIISFWEIGKLSSLNRIKLSFQLDQWFLQLEEDSILQILPLNSAIILESLRLGDVFPKDPADQLITATARVHGLKLLTVDERIQKSGMVLIA